MSKVINLPANYPYAVIQIAGTGHQMKEDGERLGIYSRHLSIEKAMEEAARMSAKHDSGIYSYEAAEWNQDTKTYDLVEW